MKTEFTTEELHKLIKRPITEWEDACKAIIAHASERCGGNRDQVIGYLSAKIADLEYLRQNP